MTLIELIAAHPGLFYRNNRDWYRDEAFMRALPNERTPRTPSHAESFRRIPADRSRLPLAVDLASAYVLDPLNPVWDDYLLCRDSDAAGQAVFVAGCANGHGFEIHRIVDHRKRLRVPVWD